MRRLAALALILPFPACNGDSGNSSATDTSTTTGETAAITDQWYPEAARMMALAGAELLLYPTAIGWDMRDAEDERMRQREAWITVQRGHAVANGLPVIVANRVGHEPDPSGVNPGLNFWGHSFVAGPQGEFLAKAGESPEVVVVEVDRGRSEQVRRIWPFLRDRRIAANGDLTKRYRD